jgi:pimeloyl-ACP methyl ester carboxylesterase
VGGLAGEAVAAAPEARPPARTRPRPVAPVNQAIADQMPLSYKVQPQQVVGVDVEKEIAINTMADIEDKRTRLIEYIWKGAGLPTTMPKVEPGVPLPPEIATLTGVRQTTKLTIPLRYGVKATQYLVEPRRPSNHRLGIYHTGHGEDPVIRVRTVQALLDLGYAVLCSDLPFTGWNVQLIQDPNDPTKYVDIGTGTKAHNRFTAYETPAFSAMTFFLQPLAVGINYAQQHLRPKSIALIGLSGGGWVATAYAAIDTRIIRSYPTAGSFPFYLRPGPPIDSTGDWEQGGIQGASVPGFYAITSFGDLYVMGAVGPRRGQLQILNRFDACCFAGVGPRTYAPVVSHRTALIGQGYWDLQEDATHNKHQVSPYALEVILWDLETNPPD